MYIPNQKGQTIIEVLIAIVVMLTGMLGVLALAQSSINTERLGSDRLVATQLAREAIETIRAQRDTNFMSSLQIPSVEDETIFATVEWDEGFGKGNGAGCGQLDENSELTFVISPGSDCEAHQLYRDPATHVYGNQGTKVKFSRTITTSPICLDASGNESIKVDGTGCQLTDSRIGIQIKADVSWMHFGQQKSAVLIDRLYNWR